MKAKVSVTLKRGILDPQGLAVLHALSSLGYTGVNDVRMGKLIELELATHDQAGAEAEVKAMCERFLANTIIEEYRIELEA
ncbi:MAG: phosphoribosylformylglycinamidine synthase subunit PurS [Nitrospirae bacterium]|nr:MAG: phosphoribosylformylglycinamidine synthase subunit PurS [Nitrospirota bacterium]